MILILSTVKQLFFINSFFFLRCVPLVELYLWSFNWLFDKMLKFQDSSKKRSLDFTESPSPTYHLPPAPVCLDADIQWSMIHWHWPVHFLWAMQILSVQAASRQMVEGHVYGYRSRINVHLCKRIQPWRAKLIMIYHTMNF